jgi:DNA polymerase
MFGGECVTYEVVGATKKWECIDTFGGKLVENCTQAISCDLLCHAMQHHETAGCRIVM